MDKALQTAIKDLKTDFDGMFYNYNSLIVELSALHAAEALSRINPGDLNLREPLRPPGRGGEGMPPAARGVESFRAIHDWLVCRG